jgi:hypothetical protein
MHGVLPRMRILLLGSDCYDAATGVAVDSVTNEQTGKTAAIPRPREALFPIP